MKWIGLLVIVGLVVGTSYHTSGAKLRPREKRFAQQGCQMVPTNSEDEVIEEDGSVTLECNFDSEPQSCLWSHNEPMNGEHSAIDPDISCSGSQGDNGEYCEDDQRIQFQFSSGKCGIMITPTKPEDTGIWKLSAVGRGPSGSAQLVNTQFELYSYNRSTVYMLDEEENDVTNGDFDTSYNRNDRQNKWEKGKNGWETVEFMCRAFGGRPEPTFHWYIEGNRNDDLANQEGNVFDVTDSRLGCEDRFGYICNAQSSIRFTIDDKLMEQLEEWGIDTNNKEDLVTFELNCETEQGDRGLVEKVSVELHINKRYDNGMLASDTIGIIVACVLVGVAFIILIACLVFAKASGRWCFADDEYGYNDPRDPRKHPGAVAHKEQGGRGHHSQQVLSTTTNTDKKSEPQLKSTEPKAEQQLRSPLFQKNKKKKTMTSGSSSNSSPTSVPKVHRGEWVNNTDPVSQHPNPQDEKPDSPTSTSSNEKPPKIPAHAPPSTGSSLTRSTRSNNDTPPPRPKKSDEQQYANLERRSFMNDPRNQVLPSEFIINSRSRTTSESRMQFASVAPGSQLV